MNTVHQKPPKILHVVISMVVGGAERLVYDMVRYPAFADNPPIVCCMDDIGELGEKLKEQGYKVYCKGRKPGFDFEMIAWLRAIMRIENVDVVHAHQYSPLVYATPAAFLAGRKKVVYTEHGRFYPDRKSWKRALVNPILAKGVDHMVSISAATADAMAEYDNFSRKRIKIIHNGIDFSHLNSPYDKAEKRKKLGIPEGYRVIGTASRLNEIKNIPMLLSVFKKVREQVDDVCLVIAGDGPEREALEALAKKLGIGGNSFFIGMRFDMPEIYPLFDVFCLTSFTEGISVTLLEALGSGVPAVVTSVGGNEDVVSRSTNASMSPLDDQDAFCLELLHLLEKKCRKEKHDDREFREHFSLSTMLNEYSELYVS